MLPVAQFPQFRSQGAAEYDFTGGPFTPVEGSRLRRERVHADYSYMRLTKTFDLTGITAASAPSCTAQLSINTEAGYDNVIVEARTAGREDWTTLPDLNGGTSRRPRRPSATARASCSRQHPFLHALPDAGATACTNTGTSGAWNAFTGSTGGWEHVAFDLSAYAGKQVEITISYVTDPADGGVGAFVDDTALVVGGTGPSRTASRARRSTWTVQGDRPRARPPNAEQLGDRPAGRAVLRRHVDAGHAAARVRARAGARPRRARRR